VFLSEGINLFSMPVNPGEWRLSDLASFIGDEVRMILSYDMLNNRFVAYMPSMPPDSPANVAVSGGTSYIVMMKEAKKVSFKGEAWEDTGTPLAAPPHLAKESTATPLLVVEGVVSDDSSSALNGIEVRVKNLRTGQSMKEITGLSAVLAQAGVTTGDGCFAIAFVDILGSRAAKAGDVLEVKAVDLSGVFACEPIKYVVTAKDIQRGKVSLSNLLMSFIPTKNALLPNYPNPFNPETWIPYQLSEASDVRIRIYNVYGQLVRTLKIGHKAAGSYTSRHKAAHWDGRNEVGEEVASGVYFYSIQAGNFRATRKLAIVK